MLNLCRAISCFNYFQFLDRNSSKMVNIEVVHMHFGFSYVGIIFLLMLFIPNGIWAKNIPEKYEEYSRNENKFLLILERIGEVLVSALVLIFSDCNVRIHSLWIGWLIAAFILMIFYNKFITYFLIIFITYPSKLPWRIFPMSNIN